MNTTMPQHFISLEHAIASLFGENIRIANRQPVAGGDINEAYCLVLTDGTKIFMKANKHQDDAFFAREAAGLDAIAQTGAIGTPKILCNGTTDRDDGYSFLLMEFIERTSPVPDYWNIFAHDLAAMHRAPTADFVADGKYGFLRDNYIGSRHQENTAHNSWISFFRECRLEPQFRHAAGYFDSMDQKRILRLLDHMDDILVEPEHPSLLHGDLWSGNVITGNDGRAWLIDPAVYVGHAEADLAMTELFGGFSPRFYDAYGEVSPLQPGYDHRRDLYNLYHLLNHLNLFGRGYLASVKRVIREYGA